MIPLQNRERKFDSLREIIGWLVDERIRYILPEYNPRKHASSKLGISESELSLFISGERQISAQKLLLLIEIAKAPEAFQFMRKYVFPENIAIIGEIK